MNDPIKSARSLRMAIIATVVIQLGVIGGVVWLVTHDHPWLGLLMILLCSSVCSDESG